MLNIEGMNDGEDLFITGCHEQLQYLLSKLSCIQCSREEGDEDVLGNGGEIGEVGDVIESRVNGKG